jgi:hypothetical protein
MQCQNFCDDAIGAVDLLHGLVVKWGNTCFRCMGDGSNKYSQRRQPVAQPRAQHLHTKTACCTINQSILQQGKQEPDLSRYTLY